MQSSISVIEEIIFNTAKLFSTQAAGTQRKLIMSSLCLLPILSNAEEAAAPISNPVAPTTLVQPAAPAVISGNEINTLIAAKTHPYLSNANFTYRADELDALYKANNYQVIWLSDADKASQHIGAVIKLLEQAPLHGLNSADYDVSILKEKLHALKPPFDTHSKDLALYDTAISLSLVRYLHDLHYGRINPRELNYDIQQRSLLKKINLPELIQSNLAQNSLDKLPERVEPQLPQYKKLQQTLAGYRSGATIMPFKMEVNAPIKPDATLPQSLALQQFLISTGDLPADKLDNTVSTYTATIAEAVKKYQQRHNIKATGILNKATVTAFNTPVTVTQHAVPIELAMERLRWLPEVENSPAIMVNIPAFQLYAYDDIQQDTPTKSMRVVVGKSADHQTPLLSADMRTVNFHPYWNVPFKIARDEILPKLASNPSYLSGQNMELVSHGGKSIGSDGGSFYAKIRQGSVGIRQKPGKGNALGKVKFIFPNKNDVYLHDTPSVSLFARARRDLSHGCVRVAEPQELAKFVLKNEGMWDVEAIKKAIANPKNRSVNLKNPIPVFFMYNTAYFNENNNLAFYPDIYGHDAKLLEALKAPRQDLSDQKIFAPPKVDVLPTLEANHTDSNSSKTAPLEALSVNEKSNRPAMEAVTIVQEKLPASSAQTLSP